MAKGSKENDIHTDVWINPETKEDHSIVVMRCGEEWWSYVDTTRIREDCTTKDEAIKAAIDHLEGRALGTSVQLRVRALDDASTTAAAMIPQRVSTSIRNGAMALLILFAITGAFALASIYMPVGSTGTSGGTAVAHAPMGEPMQRAKLPPLPARKAIPTATITTGSIRRQPETVSITNYKPSSTTIRQPVLEQPRTTSTYAPQETREQKDEAVTFTRLNERADGLRDPLGNDPPPTTTSFEASNSTETDTAAVNVARRPSSRYVPEPRRLDKSKSRQARKAAKRAKRAARHKARRARKRRARRGYRRRRLVSVRYRRIGNRRVKIVRFRRPRNLREYRRLQAARNRIIARHIRQRRLRYRY